MGIFQRVTNLFRQPAMDREIAEELQSHLDLRIESNVADGMSPQEARRDALLRFGNPTSTKERVAAFDASLALAGLGRDIRYAIRQLCKSPGFTLTVIATLAIGIGVNVAIFSSMDAVVLRPLAVPALDRVMVIAEQQQRGKEPMSLADFNDLRIQSRSFEDVAVLRGQNYTLSGAGDAAQISADLVSASFFRVLRTQAFLGRAFDESECQSGRDAVAVLNYGFWRRHFGGNSRVVGQKIQLDQHEYTVIGVLPRTMQYPPAVDMLLPFAPTPMQLADRSDHGYVALGRLRENVSVHSAQSEMQLLSQRLAKSYPATNQGWTVHIEPLLIDINGDLTPLYYKLVMGATMFVLLVVCANVANLQLARGVARRPEIAMRTALGATRKRIVRQLLTENILLALVGAGLGVAFAAIYLHLTLVLMPARVARYIPGWDNISINGRALGFSILLAVLSGVVAGLAPCVEALRIRLVDQLRAGSRQATGRSRLRSAFAVAQISLAVALVIGAALMAKGMSAMFHKADMYSPEKVLTLHPDLPVKRYDTAEKQADWYTSALDRLRAIPGVSSVELSTALPYTDSGWQVDLAIQDRPSTPGKFQTALRIAVSPGYFDAFHIPILDGRNFTKGDSVHSVPVAIVSRHFADLYHGGANPIGHRIRLGEKKSEEPWLTIVGVSQEANYGLWVNDLPPAVYTSFAQLPPASSSITVVSKGDPLSLADSARKALASVDAGVPLDPVQTYRDLIRDNLVGLMYVASMLALDAFIALLLSAIGIFAVMANLVGERTREIGVRLAMGASKEDVLRMIIRRASWLTGTGLVIGLALAFALARGVANLLRGVQPDDPVTFAAVTLIIVGVALAASWFPARQASRVDPMQALRSE